MGNGGDGFSGIDPEKLSKTISSLNKDQEKIKSSVSQIKSSFEQYGVGTAPLTELMAIAGWVEKEIPMLRRRHHLSIAEDEKYGHGYKGMVQIKESMVGATKKSQADGKKLGEKFKEKLENGDEITPEMFADLRANKADADYIKSFYGEVGSKNLLLMSNEMGDRFNDQYKEHPEQREKDRQIIAETFGTFTKVAFEGKSPKAKQAAWNKWFDDSAPADDFGFRPDFLTPLLKGGSHDKDFLVAFGDRVFQKDKQGEGDELRFFGKGGGLGEGEWGKDGYQQLFAAISRNNEASGEVVDHNYDFVQKSFYQTGPWQVDEPKERGKAFFDMVNAGTVSLKKENPTLAQKNTARILFDNYHHRNGKDTKGMHPIAGTQALYASIIAAYWDDMKHGVTSPVGNALWGGDVKAKGEEKFEGTTKWNLNEYLSGQDRNRPGLEATEKFWRALVVEAARDPEAAGTISALFQVENGRMSAHEHATRESNEDAGSYEAMERGMMQQFYSASFKETTTELEGDIDKWVSETNGFRGKIIDTASEVALGATGGAGVAGAKGAAVGVAWGLGSGTATRWLNEMVKVDENDAPEGLKNAFKGVKANTADFSWQSDYQLNANNAWEYRNVKEVTVSTYRVKDGVTETKRYTGDPKEYAKGDGNFLGEDGSIKKTGDMTRAERTAYDKWLRDPAVVAAAWPEFSKGRNARDYPGQDQ
ncbi:hypothetical protein [Streptomyces flavofungini]|uniref:hypothetical protein n=1 Tax=Streptomyces flavofungini TaxID=68200 RepID=UPI0025B204A6|nr:hypothetical protein [Streptomyces flavofungini]WJV46915.1 hypothetical protein QUY26_16095 [Streptomyces flavofungini]